MEKEDYMNFILQTSYTTHLLYDYDFYSCGMTDGQTLTNTLLQFYLCLLDTHLYVQSYCVIK